MNKDQEALLEAIVTGSGEIPVMEDQFGALGLGQRLLRIIRNAISNFDISLFSKEQFLEVVEQAFDKLIAPTLPGLISGLLKQVVLALAESFYDNQIDK